MSKTENQSRKIFEQKVIWGDFFPSLPANYYYMFFKNYCWKVKLKVGKIIRKFVAEDGRNIIFRTPKWEDLDDFVDLINSLVDEKADIYVTEKVTREEEAKWLQEVIAHLERDEDFFLVAEIEKKAVALAEFKIKGGDNEHPVGAIGIIVKKDYRNLGIGTEILKTLLEQAVFFGLQKMTINVFATNKRAIHVYKKVGFIETGIIPERHFRQGKIIDEIILTIKLPKLNQS